MKKLIIILILSLIMGTASAHVALESNEISMSIITDWDSYKQSQTAISDLGIQVEIIPASSDESIKTILNEELEKGSFLLVVGHTDVVKEFLKDNDLGGILVQPGPDSAIGSEDSEDDVKLVVVDEEDIRIGIAKMLVIMVAECSEGNYEDTSSILPVSTLIFGTILGLGAGIYFKQKN